MNASIASSAPQFCPIPRSRVRAARLVVAGILGSVLVSGLTVHAGTLLISNGSPVKILVPASDIGGDWRAASYDDANWMDGTNGVGYEAWPLEFAGPVIADSAGDWSAAGHQGENSWVNGFYDLTADPARTYTADKFQPFRRSNEAWGTNNFWDGGSWNWYPDNVPWDNIGVTFIHPNGTNSTDANVPVGIEHWSIRRWRSTYSGPVTLQFHLRKDNTSGNGVTGRVFKNGAELFSRSIAGTDTTGFTVLIPTDVNVGDFLDFAQTPEGLNSDGNDGSDGSQMTARVLAGLLVEPVAETDTFNGWSGGVQGGNNWYYGYWNRAADGDGIYDPNTDFNTTDPNWAFDGFNWLLGPADPPWSAIGQSTWHPNGDNNGGVHWVIKRWLAQNDGDYNCRVQFSKDNVTCGNGTTLHVLHNGVEKARFTIAGNDGKGIDTFVILTNVLFGDYLEFALDPLGADATYNDSCDGSRLTASIYAGAVPWVPSLRPLIATDIQDQMMGVNASVYLRFPFTVENTATVESLKLKLRWNDGYALYLNGVEVDKKNAPTVITGVTVADSIADWSAAGVQGNNGWYNGYYNRTLDSDGLYAPGDFTLFPHDGSGYGATDFWNGTGYDWFNGNPPWTELYQELTHPNTPHTDGTNPDQIYEHWVVRRWVSTVDSDALSCRFKFRKNNPNCGDGVIGYIFVNGLMVYSNAVAANDSVGRDDIVDLPEVLTGDNIDIVLAPGPNDGCDGSAFSANIFEGTPTIPWDGAATARRSASGSSATPDSLNLDAYIPQLNNGVNLLAIQGLNVTNNDADFLIVAELIANRVPVATDDTLTAVTDATTTWPASSFLANDNDPDGEAPMIVGVTPSGITLGGGVVKLMGQTVQYTPPSGYTGPDSFLYTITDISGTPVQASVAVNVGAKIDRIEPAPGPVYIVTLPGVPGVNYTLERSPTLPATTWTPVDGPKEAFVVGPLELTDANPLPDQAFYRVVITP